MASIRLNELASCCLCMVDYEEPVNLTKLGCNELHFFHTDCIDAWVAHNKTNGKTATCPMCRTNIDESKMKK
jgi:hypothetical protein